MNEWKVHNSAIENHRLLSKTENEKTKWLRISTYETSPSSKQSLRVRFSFVQFEKCSSLGNFHL